MDGNDGAGVIGWPRNHTPNFSLPQLRLKLSGVARHIFEHGRVVLIRRQLEKLQGFIDAFGQPLRQLELLDRGRTFAQLSLRFILIIPKIRRTGKPIQLLYLTLQLRDVKDAPLAHRRAF